MKGYIIADFGQWVLIILSATVIAIVLTMVSVCLAKKRESRRGEEPVDKRKDRRLLFFQALLVILVGIVMTFVTDPIYALIKENIDISLVRTSFTEKESAIITTSLKNAFDLQRSSDYTSAIKEYEKITAIDKSHPLALYNMGLCYRDLGEDYKEETENCAKKLVRYHPNIMEGYFLFAQITDDKDSEIKLGYIEKALSIEGTNVEILSYRANYYRYTLNNYESAIKDYTLLSRIDSDNIIQHRLDEAWCYEQLNQYEAALSIHNELIGNNPSDDSLYDNRAEYYIRRSWADTIGERTYLLKALEDYSSAIFLSKRPYYYDGRASVYYRLNNREGALNDHNESIHLAKSYSWDIRYPLSYALLISHRADFYRHTKQYELSIADYKTSLNYESDGAIFHSSLCELYQSLGMYQEAVDIATTGIESGDIGQIGQHGLYYIRAQAYEGLESWDNAIGDYEVYGGALGWYCIGNIRYLQSDMVSAEASYKKSLEFDSDNSQVFVGLAKIELYRGNLSKALEYVNIAIKSDEFSRYYYWRNKVYIAMEEYELAEVDLLRAIELSPEHIFYYEELAKLYDLLGTLSSYPSNGFGAKAVEIREKIQELQNSEEGG